MSTEDRLGEIEARLAGADPVTSTGLTRGLFDGHARQDVRWLLDRIRALEERLTLLEFAETREYANAKRAERERDAAREALERIAEVVEPWQNTPCAEAYAIAREALGR